MKAVLYEAFSAAAEADERARPDARSAWRRRARPGDGRLPQRLARLGRARQGHHAAARAGPRARRRRRSGRQGRPQMEAGRSRHGSLRLRLRRMPAVSGGTSAGLRPPVPARLHPLGVVRRIRLDPRAPISTSSRCRKPWRSTRRRASAAASPPPFAPSSIRAGRAPGSGSRFTAAAASGFPR